ncbi:L,D-transpeptidase family protein [uncultured Sphingomonas sp.]|uniref:L,D-transpeptidase family protein n=1 Tax=uncultured Sphingomonas sp. TaxID=158754 RepID=UPI0035CA628C
MNRLFGLAVGAVLAMTGAAPAFASDETAVAVETTAATLAPGRFVWHDPGTAEPVTVVISLPLQRAFLYRGETLVAATAVSTGADDTPTPTGVYPILQKAAAHRSNLYDASMPYMQRLTWDGIALHAGADPGFPASHGCIRLPTAFARKLFEVTTLGTAVVVTDDPLVEPRFDPELLRTDDARANEAELASLAE